MSSINLSGRGAESWWGCSDSDSDSDSVLLVGSDSGSDSDSRSDRKCRINNILVVEQVFAAQAEKRNMTFPIDFGFHSFERKIFIPIITHACWIASAPPPKELQLLDN